MNKKLISLFLICSICMTGCSADKRDHEREVVGYSKHEAVEPIFPYEIGGMTNAEIIQEVNYYFDNDLQEGQTLDDIEDICKVEPVYIVPTSSKICVRWFNAPAGEYYSGFEVSGTPGSDCITAIDYENYIIESNKDGIEKRQAARIRVDIILFSDSDAIQLYTDFCNEYCHPALHSSFNYINTSNVHTSCFERQGGKNYEVNLLVADGWNQVSITYQLKET